MSEFPVPTLLDSLATPSATVRRWLPRLALRGLGLRASERQLLLFTVDLALLCASLVVAVKLRTPWLDPPGAVYANWRWFVTLAAVWVVVSQLLDCYDLARAASAPYSMLNAGISAVLTVAIYQLIPLVTPSLESRSLMLIFALLSLGSICVWRGFYAVVFVQPAFHRNVLVYGAGWAGRALVEALPPSSAPGNPFRGTGYQIIGFVDDDPAIHRGGGMSGLPVLGGCADLLRLAREHQVDEVVLAITHRNLMSQAAFDAVLACQETGIPVTTVPALYERLLGRLPVDHIGRDIGAVLKSASGPSERFYWGFKRLVDLLAGALGMMVVAILIPLVWLANAVLCPGPIFYRQVRAGRAGHPFTLVKFRTMMPDAERATGPVWTADKDRRITKVGRLLRKSRLDELPQLYNVLRGEMSLVGPRPERPELIDGLVLQIPFYRARHCVRPGITGWAQVRFGYGNTIDAARTKLEYDLYYIRHADLYLDAIIWLKTAAVVFGLRGQ